MPSPPDPADVIAAGAVVLRTGGEVLLVHRPKYDDWSFPKGKLDRGELAPSAAVREVAEETGLDVRLGRPLDVQHYPVAAGTKTVHYWIGRVVGSDDVGSYTANAEIDQVAWVGHEKASRLLTYEHDRATLAEARASRRKTRTLVVLRHAKARSRSRWRSDDRFRPLLRDGERQAQHLVPLLAAYDVRRLVSSSSTRCVTTLVPYAEASGRHVETEDRLTEEAATPEALSALLEELDDDPERTVLCSHRPVLPMLLEMLGVADPGLDTGAMVVVHHRDGEVAAIELHGVH
ncbi:NUDIX hydrolase [Nocardioides donggukensis]|uniref:NUDIX hydrolase n=1 Tax=Nocardioides donggukensis TaxID=2774019 RepID=A0A927K1T3_9ACTN|nr:NUDIX hydrolase [Nocardioides donggukensis]MBD8868309.1 NUDIX hydrolase [Nocardioides donggukensis]